MKRCLIMPLVCTLALPAAGQSRKPDPLYEGFKNPPMSSRLRMFWRVFGPAWKKDEIDFELQELKKSGCGGVMTFFFYPVAVDDPAAGIHNQKLGSPEFLETFGYAARKAHDLGLRFGVAGGSGWPFGGPTVSIHDAAQRIRKVTVPPNQPLPQLKPGESIIATFENGKLLTFAQRPNSLPGRDRTIQRPLTLFVSGPTSMQVKRPALGGEGLVIDHYSSGAVTRWLDAVVAPMLAAAPGLVDTVFCDSLEVYNGNWTHDFPQQFKKRRGYDLISHLPALFDEKDPQSPDLRFDFWRTLAELHEERFTKVVSEWARRHGTRLEMEEYGTPPAPLTAARYIDEPDGEQYEWKGFSMSRYAASGAHLAGKRIIGAEAWTWLGIPNRMGDSLADMKLASDIHFLAGENDLIGVDYPYSPRSEPPPGWLPYYGPFMNWNNPQWPYFPALAQYVNRCQWLLRQGRNVADVAIYLPVEDMFARGPVDQMLLDMRLRDYFATGEKTGEFSLKTAFQHHSDLIHTLITHGFNFDGIDFWTMNRQAKVKNGKLVCGDGEYSIVIMPGLEGMDRAAAEKLAEFVRQGGTVIATGNLPSREWGIDSGSRTKSEAADKRLEELFKTSPKVPEYFALRHKQQGYAVRLRDAGSLARFLYEQVYAIQWPDLSYEQPGPEITFVHRRVDQRDIYYIFNMSDKPAATTVWLRGSPANVDLWNPLYGTRIKPQGRGFTHHGEASGYDLDLPAFSSVFLITEPESRIERARGRVPSQGGDEGKSSGAPLKSEPQFSVWHLHFDGPDAPKPRNIQDLVSWTTWPDARFFSGQGVYETTLDRTGPVPKKAILRFEEVHEAAEVLVNGKSAGVLFVPPYSVDIAGLLHPGKNTLKVAVGNLPINRFLGLPDQNLRPLRAAYGNRFPDPQEKRVVKEPVPSGLIGKVWLETGE